MMGTFTNTGWAYFLGDGFRSFLEIVLGQYADNISFVHFLAQAMKSVPMGITHFSGVIFQVTSVGGSTIL